MSVLLPIPFYFDTSPHYAPQEDPLSPWAVPGDNVWTKGLRAAEPTDHHVSLPELWGKGCSLGVLWGCPVQDSELFKTKAKQVLSETICVHRLLSGDS